MSSPYFQLPANLVHCLKSDWLEDIFVLIRATRQQKVCSCGCYDSSFVARLLYTFCTCRIISWFTAAWLVGPYACVEWYHEHIYFLHIKLSTHLHVSVRVQSISIGMFSSCFCVQQSVIMITFSSCGIKNHKDSLVCFCLFLTVTMWQFSLGMFSTFSTQMDHFTSVIRSALGE